MKDNSIFLLAVALVIVFLLWVAYKARMTRGWRRERKATVKLDTRPVEYAVLTAQQTTRWLSFVYAVTRRTKYVIMAVVAMLLAGIYTLVPAGNMIQEVLRFVISLIILAGLAIGLSAWHKWAEQQQRRVGRRIQWTEEQLLLSYGVLTRHPETGFYTRDFLIQMLETLLGQMGESLPLACLMVEIRGLAEFEEQHGRDEAIKILKKVGRMLSRSARPYDLTGHDSDQRLTLILLRYPVTLSLENRFVIGTQHKVLDEINHTYNSNLELAWTRANLPSDAPTPLQLLSRARSSLDHPQEDQRLDVEKAAALA